jgi:hypothetical protein
VISQHIGVITSLSPSGGGLASVTIESSGGTGSATATGTAVTLGSALTVTGSDLIYACVSTGSYVTISTATGFNIRTNLNFGNTSESIGVIDALGATSNTNPSLVLASSYSWSFVGVAFKAASGSTWTHNWSGSTQATANTQASLVVTAGGAVTTGDLIVVTVAYDYASGVTVNLSDGTNTYSTAVTYNGGPVGEITFYHVWTAATVPSGYAVTATLSGGTQYWASMVVDDYTASMPGSLAINWALADSFTVSALSGPTTITFSNAMPGQKIDLILGSNGQTATWPTGITGVGFTWPLSLSGTGLRDEFVIKCIAANTYLGYLIGQGF